jgi:choline monooxygenase
MFFNINPEISKASTLPTEFYLDHKYFDFCLNNIFPDSWQLITDIKTIENNNIYPFTFFPSTINEPLILINNQNKTKCFSNVCTHRAHLVVDKPCNKNKLRCMYHGRTFNLDGSFNYMPGFENAQDFPTEKENLQTVPVINWKNFIWASLKGNIDIMPILNDIEIRLPHYPFDTLTHNEKSSKSWEIDAHWAIYCENYLEGFHVPFVHKGLIKEINFETYETILLESAVLQIAEGEKNSQGLKNSENIELNIYGLYYWIFPNIMLNFYSWGLSINIIEPISPNKTRIRFLSYPIKDKLQPSAGNATLNQVEEEDQKAVLNVQQGIKSRYFNSGRYSPKYEKGIHCFHLLLDKYLC